jgi:hypothetical protein
MFSASHKLSSCKKKVVTVSFVHNMHHLEKKGKTEKEKGRKKKEKREGKKTARCT